MISSPSGKEKTAGSNPIVQKVVSTDAVAWGVGVNALILPKGKVAKNKKACFAPVRIVPFGTDLLS